MAGQDDVDDDAKVHGLCNAAFIFVRDLDQIEWWV